MESPSDIFSPAELGEGRSALTMGDRLGHETEERAATPRLRRRMRYLRAALTWSSRPRQGERWTSRPRSIAPGKGPLPDKEPDHVRLLTLNMCHGRRRLPHQTLLPRHAVRRNLGAIGTTLQGLMPDIVALQEADGPSAWSGNFDHVATLAQLGELDTFYRGDHNLFGVGRFSLATGTALMARYPLLDPRSHRFGLSWRDTKGFVVATVPVPQWNGSELDVVSVHLDFLTPSARRKQIRSLVERLAERQRPLVVLGDLNCCWQREPKSMELLTRTLGLRAYRPEHRAPTYPAHRPRRRLDWILISKQLTYGAYRRVPTPLSDHLGVMADLALRAA